VKLALAGAVLVILVLVLAVVFNGGAAMPGAGSTPSSANVSNSLMVSSTLVSSLTSPNTFMSGTSTTNNPSSVSIIKANVTVMGQAAGIPCGALRLPCPLYTNESVIFATLIRYDGTYYYVSYIKVNDIQYTVWYDNSTYYCVTPRVDWANACPIN
jgi:hypothetical protein